MDFRPDTSRHSLRKATACCCWIILFGASSQFLIAQVRVSDLIEFEIHNYLFKFRYPTKYGSSNRFQALICPTTSRINLKFYFLISSFINPHPPPPGV